MNISKNPNPVVAAAERLARTELLAHDDDSPAHRAALEQAREVFADAVANHRPHEHEAREAAISARMAELLADAKVEV